MQPQNWSSDSHDQSGEEVGFSRGFTLIELLVVIAVIAILASLLLPRLSRAKDAARFVKCKSNLRPSGIGLNMYVQNFSFYPMGGAQRGWDNLMRTGWQNKLREYSGEPVHFHSDHGAVAFEKTGVFRCPAVEADSKLPNIGEWWLFGYENDFYAEHYGYNEEGFVTGQGLGWRDWVEGIPTKRVREQDVQVPTKMLALGDGFCGMKDGQWIVRGPLMCHGNFVSGPPSDDETKRSRRRHNDRSNVIFCDGHVQDFKLDKLVKSTAAEDLRRWNRNNEPDL